MAYTVVFAPEAEDQLEELYLYIADQASSTVAERYTGAVVSCCEGLGLFPHRGVPREDIRPGLRLTNYKGRTVIAFAVDDAGRKVSIVGVFYGGRDYESDLRFVDED
jgi:plasmid stabilization system protein ParE